MTVGKAADILMNGYVANTPDPKLDELLSRGGIMSMLGSASLILLALALGGLLIKYLIVDTIVQELKEKMDRPSRLVGFTALSCIGINLIVGEQYLVHHSSRRNIRSVLLMTLLIKNLFDTNTSGFRCDRQFSLVPWGVSGTFIMGNDES